MALRLAGLASGVLLVLWGLAPSGAQSDNYRTEPTSTLFSFGVEHGDNVINDVTTYTQVDLPFSISFLDFCYSTLFISADGTVGLEGEVKYQDVNYFQGVKNPLVDVPFVAPLLYKGYRPIKIDPGEYQGKISYRAHDLRHNGFISSENAQLRDYLVRFLPDALIHAPDRPALTYLVVVTWYNVADGADTGECVQASPCNSTTFQLVLTGNANDTFAIFNYDSSDINVQTNYMAGFNAGRGRGWHNVLPCHSGCDTRLSTSTVKYLSNYQGSDTKGRYVFSVGREKVVRGGCLAKELSHGILEVYPRTVGMFGGEKLEVSGMCGTPNTQIYCRFGSGPEAVNRTVVGAMVTTMKGYCPVPLLTMTGRLDIYWSNNNREWTAYQSINVALPSRLGDPVAVDQSVRETWYKRDSREITVKWDPAQFSKGAAVNVEVKVLGYRESERQVVYQELKTVGTAENSRGSYTFNVDQYRCTSDCEQFEIGLLEVSLPAQYHGSASERVAVRFGPIPLGWYVNAQLTTQRGSDWSDQKCHEWRQADARDTQWLKNLLPCPCSLDQALADFGRWQADPGCDLFKGSRCHYHKGSKHCVRAVVPTSPDGSGNQCCYNQDGTLRYSQLSHEGSTPDRSHVWGAHPYNRPGRVPELSHWRHDVISFYYCCLWNNYKLCDLYMEQRPTADCRNYDVPGLGFIYGHTHIRTWDGLSYNFIASGDFWLAESKDTHLIVQGKFEARAKSWDLGYLHVKQSWKPKALTSLAVSSGNSHIEVAVSAAALSRRRGLDVRVDGAAKYFLGRASVWQDFPEFTIINNAPNVTTNHHDNFTILLHHGGIGINVAAVNGLLEVVVALPPTLKPKTGSKPVVAGLLGTYDLLPNNEYQTREGEVIFSQTDKRAIMERFALSWRLKKEDYGTFKFESTASDHLDPLHTYLEYSQIPSNFSGAPSVNTVNAHCGTSDNCKWDYQITGEEGVARATKDAEARIANLQRLASPVDSCGLPEDNIIVSPENFLVGNEVKVTGCKQGQSLANSATYRCVRETLREATQNGRADYGNVRTDPGSKEDYITHWVPKPQAVCSAATSGDSSNLALIIGVCVGAAVALIIIIVVVVIIVRRKKLGSSETIPKETRSSAPKETRSAAPREKREVITDS